MVTVRARIPSTDDTERILPLAVPDIREVREFALHLHGANRRWQGNLFGWPAEYAPESRRRPVDSKMAHTPASFWIGESGIWFYSLRRRHKIIATSSE